MSRTMPKLPEELLPWSALNMRPTTHTADAGLGRTTRIPGPLSASFWKFHVSPLYLPQLSF